MYLTASTTQKMKYFILNLLVTFIPCMGKSIQVSPLFSLLHSGQDFGKLNTDLPHPQVVLCWRSGRQLVILAAFLSFYFLSYFLDTGLKVTTVQGIRPARDLDNNVIKPSLFSIHLIVIPKIVFLFDHCWPHRLSVDYCAKTLKTYRFHHLKLGLAKQRRTHFRKYLKRSTWWIQSCSQ